jgi:hypothetical protein
MDTRSKIVPARTIGDHGRCRAGRGRRLVENQHRRIAEQSVRDAEALTHTEGVSADSPAGGRALLDKLGLNNRVQVALIVHDAGLV